MDKTVKEYQYPNLDTQTPDELYKRRRDLCDSLEEVTAQLSGRLIESALENVRLKNALSAIIEGGRMSDNKRALYLVEIAKAALFFEARG
jgi:adenine-specific DNA methylase